MQTVAAPPTYADPQRPDGGHAVVRLPGWGVSAGVRTTARICRIEKNAPVYLSPEGWRANEYAWDPAEIRADGEDLEIVLGPDIVSQIEQYEVIRIDFAELDAQTQVSWGNIAPSRGKSAAPVYLGRARFHVDEGGQVILEGKISDKGVTRPYREEFADQDEVLGLPYARIYEAWEGELEFDPDLRQAKIISSTGRPTSAIDRKADLTLETASPRDAAISQSDAPEETRHALPESSQLEEKMDEPSAPPTSSGKTDPAASDDRQTSIRKLPIPLISGLAVMILLIGAFLLYFDGLPELAGLFGRDEEPEQSQGMQLRQPAEPDESAQQGPSDDPEEAGPPSLEELHNRGVAAAEAGLMDDAVRLFRRPLAAGYVPTLLYYGEHYDSVDFSPFLVAQPNDQTALEFYKRACEAGSEEAQSRVEALRRHLEARAADGDVVADDILFFFYPDIKEACET